MLKQSISMRKMTIMTNKKIPIEENIQYSNDMIAAENLNMLVGHGILGLNLMASPGAGKTSLIEMTIKSLSSRFTIGVIDGDLASSIDADRAKSAGAISYQINTGGGCHLDSFMVQKALKDIPLHTIDLLIIENVGNLVCPISFKIGTQINVLIASIPEGDDKPYKYPPMYRGVDVVVLNKIDLLPYIEFNKQYFFNGIKALNPTSKIIEISCKTGNGFDTWIDWLNCEISKIRNTK